MPREAAIRACTALERVLMAGAHLAPGDPALARCRGELERLAGAAPALARLADAVAATTGPGGGRSMLDAAASARQVRFALAAAAAADGDPRPLAPLPRTSTPCNARRLGEIRAALRGRQRMASIGHLRSAIERGEIADLRLFDDLVASLVADGFADDGDEMVADLVANEIAPLIGAPLAARLASAVAASPGDPRLLRALAAVEPPAAVGHLSKALASRRQAVRLAALDTVRRHLPGDPRLEAAVLASARHAAEQVRSAALFALSGYGSDAAVAALELAAGDPATHEIAARSLGSSPHPRAVEVLLDRLGAALAGPPSPDGGTVGLEPLLSALREVAHRSPDLRIADLVRPLADRHATAASILSMFDGQAGVEAVAVQLGWHLPDRFFAAAEAASRLPPARIFDLLAPLLDAPDCEVAYMPNRLGILWLLLQRGPIDPRWAEACLGHLDAGPQVSCFAAQVLGRLAERRAVTGLLAMLAGGRSPEQQATAIVALSAIGDRGAVPGILAWIDRGDWMVRSAALQALVALGGPDLPAQVRALHDALDDPTGHEHWHLRNLLLQLSKVHPGGEPVGP